MQALKFNCVICGARQKALNNIYMYQGQVDCETRIEFRDY